MTLSLRSEPERQAMIDGYHGIVDIAKRWAEDGKSLDEFVEWLATVADMLGPPTWG